jgi:chaperonin GroES
MLIKKSMLSQSVPQIDRLLGARALVRRLDPDSKTRGGILLPDTAQKKSRTARVMMVGPGKFVAELDRIIPFPANPGDIVLIGQHAGVEVQFDGETYVLVMDDEVFAILNDGEIANGHDRKAADATAA